MLAPQAIRNPFPSPSLSSLNHRLFPIIRDSTDQPPLPSALVLLVASLPRPPIFRPSGASTLRNSIVVPQAQLYLSYRAHSIRFSPCSSTLHHDSTLPSTAYPAKLSCNTQYGCRNYQASLSQCIHQQSSSRVSLLPHLLLANIYLPDVSSSEMELLVKPVY